MKTLKLSALTVLTAVFFAACGDDVTKVTQEASGLEIVATADSLGKCTAERSGEMRFASKENAVFVCADSAWQNVSAAQKASCSAELLADSSGFKIVCGGDSVGVIFNGKDGSGGESGEIGADGKFCTVEESPLLDSDFGRGAYQVVCGGEIVGTIRNGISGEGCSLTDNGDGTVTQDCGGETITLYKAFCGGKVYDPDSSFCYGDSVVTLCGGKAFNPTENFCSGGSLYAFCNGKSYDPQDSVCHEERLFGFFEDSRDGQVYRTVQIGTQTWMAENLNYAYLQKTTTEDSSSFCYNDSTEYCEKYGRLYMWSAAMDSVAQFTENGKECGFGKTCSPTYPVRGACPEGWHLPDTTEWYSLIDFVAKKIGDMDSVGYALKSISGSDVFGFGALPAGIRAGNGKFYFILEDVEFWTSVEWMSDYDYGPALRLNNWYSHISYALRLNNWYSHISYPNGNKGAAFSIRCVKDN